MIKLVNLKLINQIVLTATLIFLVGNINLVFAQNGRNQVKDSDKLKIINQILLTENLVNTKQERDGTKVFLSSQNLPADLSKLVKKVDRIEINLLSEGNINEKTKYGFEYYKFDEIISNRNLVTVKLSSIWENSTSGETTINGTIYHCSKRNTAWSCKYKGFYLGRS